MRAQVGNPSPSLLVKSCTSEKGLNNPYRLSIGMPDPVSVTMNCPECALRFLNSKVIFPVSVCYAALSNKYNKIFSKASALVRTVTRGTFNEAATSGLNPSLALFMMFSQRVFMFKSLTG